MKMRGSMKKLAEEKRERWKSYQRLEVRRFLGRRGDNSASDPDPYHLAGSGSISDDTDPGSAKNLPKNLPKP